MYESRAEAALISASTRAEPTCLDLYPTDDLTAQPVSFRALLGRADEVTEPQRSLLVTRTRAVAQLLCRAQQVGPDDLHVAAVGTAVEALRDRGAALERHRARCLRERLRHGARPLDASARQRLGLVAAAARENQGRACDRDGAHRRVMAHPRRACAPDPPARELTIRP